ncbi:serine hydrolase [Lutibacter sp.]|uniref:serine hydrolase domain-containing protein n=1 Tax=Lutibacter sp. TaxID=1925666 RepID=UPI0027333CD1|nr:serine hydrolase domain-containing protein [Lutibacter sp.]MDP3311789.1 serine hydrolase domain-containing protein [Lutibacter sp.]
MKKLTLLILLIFQIFKVGFSQSNFDFSDFENQINKEIDNRTIPSISVAIAKDGVIIYEKAFGLADLENKVMATISTSYQLASASKPMTATGIMILCHKKVIDLYSSVEKYISPLKFKVFEGVSSEVKVIDLLNHTSGLGTYFQIGYADENIRSDDFETAFNKYGGLYHPTGLICEYSNLGYGLLDFIISKQSGKSYSKFMKDELFRPLGMDNTFIDKPDNPKFSVAKKYDSKLILLPDVSNNTKGAGNVYSSIHDLALFGMFHLKNGQKGLLSSEEIDLTHNYINPKTLYHYYDSTLYGLGWYFKTNDNGYKIIWHEGGMMGASSMIKLIPGENVVIAVIINTSNQQLCQNVTNKLSKIILPKYNPSPINEVAAYKYYTSDSTYFGDWQGTIKVGELDVPCTLKIQPDGNIIIEYLDFTYKSYFTQNNPIPHKTILLAGLVNKNSFIGMFPGNLPSVDIRHELSQFMSLKLYKDANVLSGTIVAIAAANREYYAYPFYIKLERK